MISPMILIVLPAALLLDLVLGDPPRLPHPIRWLGRAIDYGEPAFRKLPFSLVVSGALFAGLYVLGTWLVVYVLVSLAGQLHPWLRVGLELVLVYFCLSIRSLAQAAEAVVHGFMRLGVKGAKDKVRLIVGRDVQSLDRTGVFRATVETVAENLVDGVIAPLFFAAIGGAPLCMAYKMINTLDSMIGYKNEKYLEFGKAAARLDDVANFLPARLAIPCIALAAQILARDGRQAFRAACDDGHKHASPNAGYPEAAFAGALEVKLGGPNYYGGQLVEKPYIGAAYRSVTMMDIRKSCDLMILSALVCFTTLYILLIGWHALT